MDKVLHVPVIPIASNRPVGTKAKGF